MICHNGSTICVASPSVQEHLNHGDRLGSCASGNAVSTRGIEASAPDISISSGVGVYPNPTTGQFSVQLNNFKGTRATVLLLNMRGQVMDRKEVVLAGHVQTIKFNISNQAQSVYFVKVLDANGTKTEKIVLQR